MKTKEMIECTGLDGRAPYSLGNRQYLYFPVCPVHGKVEKDAIKIEGGQYDGYKWAGAVHRSCGATLESIPKDKYEEQINYLDLFEEVKDEETS